MRSGRPDYQIVTPSNFKQMFNPFRELCADEKVLAYEHFADTDDREALRLIEDAWDEDVYIDLRSFGITTRDY
jgi:hypothetical protein